MNAHCHWQIGDHLQSGFDGTIVEFLGFDPEKQNEFRGKIIKPGSFRPDQYQAGLVSNCWDVEAFHRLTKP